MSKRLEGNGLWASSRMFLPEHKDRNNKHTSELDLKTKPILDEQRLEEIGDMIRIAYEERREITLVVFDKRGNQSITGNITKVDAFKQQIWIEGKRVQLIEVVDCVP